MSSDYSFRPGGSLKLKGTVADGGVIKKKKKKSKDKDPTSKTSGEKAREKEKLREALYNDASASGSGNGSDSGAPSSSSSRKTEAEKRFEEVQRERLLKRVAKLAGKTHKDRVNEFNNHLESLSEHHDIPKVGPG